MTACQCTVLFAQRKTRCDGGFEEADWGSADATGFSAGCRGMTTHDVTVQLSAPPGATPQQAAGFRGLDRAPAAAKAAAPKSPSGAGFFTPADLEHQGDI
jgi:hypothetical protein